MIALNAGAGIYVLVSPRLQQAVEFAQDILYGGQALEKMSILAEFTKNIETISGRLRTSHDRYSKYHFR
jgi:anthranilate phosphoribosyltransferase